MYNEPPAELMKKYMKDKIVDPWETEEEIVDDMPIIGILTQPNPKT